MQGFTVGDPRKTGKVKIKDVSMSLDKLPLVLTAMDDKDWKVPLDPIFVRNEDGCISNLESVNALENQLCMNNNTNIDMKIF